VSRRDLKWAVPSVSLVLIVLVGTYLAWERQRYRLETSEGTLRVGMTPAEVEALLGPEDDRIRSPDLVDLRLSGRVWYLRDGAVEVYFHRDGDGRVASATWFPVFQPEVSIPRPSLFAHVRSWLTRKD
jgi:hypothetical protein